MRLAIFTDTFTPQVNGVAKTLDRLTHFYKNKTSPIPYLHRDIQQKMIL